jgi:hypothetical protein
MTTDNFCFYLQYRLIQTSQTGGQPYSDASPFSIPWTNTLAYLSVAPMTQEKNLKTLSSQVLVICVLVAGDGGTGSGGVEVVISSKLFFFLIQKNRMNQALARLVNDV